MCARARERGGWGTGERGRKKGGNEKWAVLKGQGRKGEGAGEEGRVSCELLKQLTASVSRPNIYPRAWYSLLFATCFVARIVNGSFFLPPLPLFLPLFTSLFRSMRTWYHISMDADFFVRDRSSSGLHEVRKGQQLRRQPKWCRFFRMARSVVLTYIECECS